MVKIGRTSWKRTANSTANGEQGWSPCIGSSFHVQPWHYGSVDSPTAGAAANERARRSDAMILTSNVSKVCVSLCITVILSY